MIKRQAAEGLVGAAFEQGQLDDLEEIIAGGQFHGRDHFVAYAQYIGLAAVIIGAERQGHTIDLRHVVLQRVRQRNGYFRLGVDGAIVLEIVFHLVGLHVAGSEVVETALVVYPEADEQGHGGDGEKVSKHGAVVSDSATNRMPKR